MLQRELFPAAEIKRSQPDIGDWPGAS